MQIGVSAAPVLMRLRGDPALDNTTEILLVFMQFGFPALFLLSAVGVALWSLRKEEDASRRWSNAITLGLLMSAFAWFAVSYWVYPWLVD